MQIYEFRSAAGLAKAVCIMLGILAVLGLIVQAFNAFEFYTYGIFGNAASEGSLSVSSILGSILGMVLGVLTLAVIVVFLIWQNQAAKNTLAMNPNSLSISPGWAVGWWFIPFASLVMPFLSINEINNGSKPENALDPAYGGDTSGSGLTIAWWLLYIGSGIISLVSAVLAFMTMQQPDYIMPMIASLLAAQAASFASAFLAIKIVSDIDRNQEESFRSLGNRSQYYSPPPPPSDYGQY